MLPVSQMEDIVRHKLPDPCGIERAALLFLQIVVEKRMRSELVSLQVISKHRRAKTITEKDVLALRLVTAHRFDDGARQRFLDGRLALKDVSGERAGTTPVAPRLVQRLAVAAGAKCDRCALVLLGQAWASSAEDLTRWAAESAAQAGRGSVAPGDVLRALKEEAAQYAGYQHLRLDSMG